MRAAVAPAGPSRARAPRIDALTGLRIFPALAVLLSHLRAPPWAGPHLSAFFDSGYAGVTVFFVLSGFVLTHNYFDRFVGQLSLRLVVSYFAARLVRVYPLYLLVLLWVTFPALSSGSLNDELWLKHALGLQAWLGTLQDVYAFNAPGWSISVEFFLYASFPLLVSLLLPVLRTPRRIGVALVLVLGLISGLTLYFYVAGYANLPWTDARSAHRWLYRNPACRLGDFLLGMLAARLVACKLAIPPRWIFRGAALASAVIVALMCWPAHVWSAASWDISYALPGAALIFFLASAPPSPGLRWLASKPLVLLGEASYALYLCHATALDRLGVGLLGGTAWLAGSGLTVLLILAFAIGLHVGFERPARELLRAVLDPLSRRGVRAASSEGEMGALRPGSRDPNATQSQP